MDYIGIFQGGGIKAIAYVGAIIALEERGFNCVRAAGISSGAIVASLLMTNYHGKELLRIVKTTNFANFAKSKFPINNMIKKKGIVSSRELEIFLQDLYLKKGYKYFGDLKTNSESKLKVVATSINKRFSKVLSKIIIPDDLPNYNINPDEYRISKAVIMSSTIPLFYGAHKLGNSFIIDGGIIESIPKIDFNLNINKIYFCFNDRKIQDKMYKIVIRLPKYRLIDFNINENDIRILLSAGYQAALIFINDFFKY